MSLFLSTEDGRILLADIDQRHHFEMADFDMRMTDIAVTEARTLLGTDGRLVYRLDIGTGVKTPIALISSEDIVSVDADSSERAIIGTASGQIWRQERDGSLTDIGLFDGGIQEMARIGGFAYAATNAGTLAVMNLLDGSVTELLAHRLGDIDAISADNGRLRLTVSPGSSAPQFFLFDPKTLDLVFENGLLGFYDEVTGATSGDIGTVVFTADGGQSEFVATALGDVLEGGDSDIAFYARAGDDTVSGGAGDDLLYGEAGNDIITGGLGDDLVDGGAGDDSLAGGAGDDQIDGGEGQDWAVFDGAAATVDLTLLDGQDTGHGRNDVLRSIENLRGSDFADKLYGNDLVDNEVEGGAGDDTLWGRGGDDTLRGGDGNDMLRGGAGDDCLDGGAGFDVVAYAGEAAVTVRLDLIYWQDTGGQGIDKLSGIDGVIGADGHDSLSGNANANLIDGDGGRDTVLGGGGADTLDGGPGADFLHGGDGADTLIGAGGRDTLNGGLGTGSDLSEGGVGADTFVFTVQASNGQREARLTIADFDAAEGDVIDLVGETAAGFDTWQVTAMNGAADSLIRFANGTEIVLSGISEDEIAANWFV